MKFVKNFELVEAVKFDGSAASVEEVKSALHASPGISAYVVYNSLNRGLIIETLRTERTEHDLFERIDCSPGKYVVIRVNGEVYVDYFHTRLADQYIEASEVSDGYHSFNELYQHRARLFSTLMHAYPKRSWWSHRHHDNKVMEGWIIAGIDTPEGSVTYPLPVKEIPNLPTSSELTHGREWDGHTADDVLTRLLSLRAEQWEGYDADTH